MFQHPGNSSKTTQLVCVYGYELALGRRISEEGPKVEELTMPAAAHFCYFVSNKSWDKTKASSSSSTYAVETSMSDMSDEQVTITNPIRYFPALAWFGLAITTSMREGANF